MVSSVYTAALLGYQGQLVKTEVDILPGLMGVHIVGLGDNSVKEAKNRVRSAIVNSGFSFPIKTVIVNLAPNEVPKEGGLAELSMALGILLADGQITSDFFHDKLILGGLSLDGSVQTPAGLLASVILARETAAISAVVIPKEGLDEASCVPGIDIIAVNNLRDLAEGNFETIRNDNPKTFFSSFKEPLVDISEIKNQAVAKRGLAIALSGEHHSFLIGTPGSGKTMLARAAEGLQMPLTLEESLEITRLYSAVGKNNGTLMRQRPFRAPHHTTSGIALVGGGSRPLPGEVSLSHKGILFLDELLEFSASTLQSLREPLEDKKITISRARGSFTFPADFTLIAATNPCQCGYLFSSVRACSCKPYQIQNLYRKILGPFLDRISLEIETNEEQTFLEKEKNTAEEKSQEWWRSHIQEAKNRMLYRNNMYNTTENKNLYNGQIAGKAVLAFMEKFPPAFELFKELSRVMNITHRGAVNSARVAVTIMDFEENSELLPRHVEEAFSYRVFSHYQKKMYPLGA